jgi:hypothetical protein
VSACVCVRARETDCHQQIRSWATCTHALPQPRTTRTRTQTPHIPSLFALVNRRKVLTLTVMPTHLTVADWRTCTGAVWGLLALLPLVSVNWGVVTAVSCLHHSLAVVRGHPHCHQALYDECEWVSNSIFLSLVERLLRVHTGARAWICAWLCEHVVASAQRRPCMCLCLAVRTRRCTSPSTGRPS